MAIPPGQLAPFLQFVANGDAEAYSYLEIMARVVYQADDLVDEDLNPEGRQELMAALLWDVFVELPRNTFHRRNAATLAPLLSDVIVQWHKSDQWRRAGAPGYARAVFGFVRRENMDGLVGAVAGIVGGREHAMAVAELVMDVCHADGETVEEWLGAENELRKQT